MSEYGRLVGVKFEGRQETLKELYNDNPWREVTLIRKRFLNNDTGIVEPAIQVYDYKTKLDMGWIAKKELKRYDGISKMSAVIGNYSDNNNISYCVSLYLQGYGTSAGRRVG